MGHRTPSWGMPFGWRWGRGAEVGAGRVPDRATNTRESLEVTVTTVCRRTWEKFSASLELTFCPHTVYALPLNLVPGTFCSLYQGLKTCFHFPRGPRRWLGTGSRVKAAPCRARFVPPLQRPWGITRPGLSAVAPPVAAAEVKVVRRV